MVESSLAVGQEELISHMLGDLDLLDSQKFDPIEYINAIFPSEQSFSTVDPVLLKIQSKANKMDLTVREMLQQQTDSDVDGGRKELELAHQSIQKLYEEIRRIKDKARHAEQTVQDITKDIKSLDCAKKNLTSSITALKRLQMLVSAVDQLKAMAQKRQYKEAAIMFQAAKQLSENFTNFKNIKQIAELLQNIANIEAEMRRMVFGEFEGSFNQQGGFTGDVSSLNSVCCLVDALGPDTNLENVARRYAWLKRLCKTFDEEHAMIFPKEWKISELVCLKFCEYTRADMEELLSKTPNLDVKELVRTLQITLEFEAGLVRRFGSLNDQESKNLLSGASAFKGLVSRSFDPHMHIFLEAEDKKLFGMAETFRASSNVADDDTGVFTSSADLFLFYRQTLVNLARLTNGRPFLDLGKLFGKWLMIYSDILQTKIPKEDKRQFAVEDIRIICAVLNTAEYCQNTALQLEEKLKEKIDDIYKDQVSLSKERDMFLVLITTSIQALVRQIVNYLNLSFQTMCKMPWSTIQSVSDQSEYVTTMSSVLNNSITQIRSSITNGKQFKWFCDKFVDSFIPLLVKTIYQCKPISEIGAEQMLLDLHAIKSTLLDLPNLGTEKKVPVSAIYTKFVTKGVLKAETLLKIVLTPLDPAEALVKNFLILSSDGDLESKDEKTGLTPQKVTELKENFVRILDLKGVRKADQSNLVDLLTSRINKNNSWNVIQPLMGTTLNTGPSPIAHANASAKSSVVDAGNKLNENFKRFATAMGDIKTASWINKGTK